MLLLLFRAKQASTAQVRLSGQVRLLIVVDKSAPVELYASARLAVTGRRASTALGAPRVAARAQVVGLAIRTHTQGALTVVALADLRVVGRVSRLNTARMAQAAPFVLVTALPKASRIALDLRTRSLVDVVAVSYHPTLGPFDPLTKIDLGSAYRGDTLILPLWEARDQRGIVLDLTEADLWFTAKTNLDDTDLAAPTIQCTNQDGGGIEVLDPPLGIYRVTIAPFKTQPLADDTVFRWDVQVITDAPRTTTVRVGTLIVVRDVTRVSS